MYLIKLPTIIFFIGLFAPSYCNDSSLAQELNVDERPALPFPPSFTLDSQCGPVDDLQDVELYNGALGVTVEYVNKNEPSTVQLQWLSEAEIMRLLPGYAPGNIAGERWCTGTRIDTHHILTAGHCFDIQQGQNGWYSPFTMVRGQVKYADPKVLATLQRVNFRYQVNGTSPIKEVREPEDYPITRLLEYREGPDNLDYAIIEFGKNLEGEFPVDKFPPAFVLNRSGSNGETIAIIQHPQGEPKKIEAGGVLRVTDFNLFYNDIDTHGGSSGAGVRDRQGKIIGVHTNGGCTSDANRGVSIQAIANVSKLFKNNPFPIR